MKKLFNLFFLIAIILPLPIMAQIDVPKGQPPPVKPFTKDSLTRDGSLEKVELIVQSNVEPNLRKSAENDSLALQFGLEIEKIIKEEDVEAFSDIFDFSVYKERILDQAEEVNSSNQTFADSWVHKNIDTEQKSMPGFLKSLNNGFFNFVFYRYDAFQESYVLLFRKFSEELGLNYLEFRINKRNGEMRYNDIYSYYEGLSFSKNAAEILDFQLLANSDDSAKPELRRNMELYGKANTAISKKEFGKAYQYLDSLSGDMRHSKSILNNKVRTASHISNKDYRNSLKELESYYKEDAGVCLTLIDYYSYQQDTKKVMSLIKIIEAETMDTFLNYIRANYYSGIGDYDSATPLYKQMMYEYRTFVPAYFQYIDLNLNTKNYEEVAKTFGYLTDIGVDKNFLISSTETANEDSKLKEFSKSKFYSKWKKQANKSK